MRNTGSTNGSGGERGASALQHPDTSRADHELGFIARITPRRGPRGMALAEKTARGWTRRAPGRRAFTRVELCACLAAVALLALLTLPALASAQSRGRVAQCLNNLRQMGRAVQMWASDFEGQPPWRTPVQNGGLLPYTGTRAGNAWSDLVIMSNQLVTPRILTCPAERGLLIARDFAQYSSILYRNNATSYILNLDVLMEFPGGFLFGDRNVQFTANAQFCSSGVNNPASYNKSEAANHGWTNAIHGLSGNLVIMDGSVAETTSDQLRAAMGKSRDDNGQYLHLLKPR